MIYNVIALALIRSHAMESKMGSNQFKYLLPPICSKKVALSKNKWRYELPGAGCTKHRQGL